MVSSVSPLEVVEVLVLESSGDVVVVPEALDGPSEVNTNTNGGGANKCSDDHAPFIEETSTAGSVPGEAYGDNCNTDISPEAELVDSP